MTNVTRTLFRGGRIYTPDGPPATALCVEDGRVVWTGDDSASIHFEDNADRVVELNGRLVTPAFVDAHAHLASTGLAILGVDLSAAGSAEKALDHLAGHARTSPLNVVLGHSWDETGWPDQRVFTRAELDRAVGPRAAYVGRVDGHSAMVSTALVDEVIRDDEGDDPRRYEGWSDQGPLTREAHHASRHALHRLLAYEDHAAAIRLGLQTAAARGIGMVHELGNPHINASPGDFSTINRLREEAATGGTALPDLVGYWGEASVDLVVHLGLEGAAGDYCMDGSIGSRTSALHTPYADGDGCGHLYVTADEVRDHVVACSQAGIQAGFHVIGDRAAAEVMAGFAQAAQKIGADAVRAGRHRLEHVEMFGTDEIAALAQYGVTASMQPQFDALWGGEDGLYAQRLGADRALPMNAFASLQRAGVALAFGSDSPVTPMDPWAAVRAAAWHRTETERISVRGAFDAHTRGGWRAARRDDGGTLAVGAPASIAVWDVPGGLPATSASCLPDLAADGDLPQCTMTMVGGQVAFEAAGALT